MAGLLQVILSVTLIAILLATSVNLSFGWSDQFDTIKPEQIHISLGRNETEMVITWVTLSYTQLTFVQYGYKPNSLANLVRGSCKNFTDGGSEKRTLYIHKAVLSYLKPDQVYYYRVGITKQTFSDVYHFKTIKSGVDWSPSFVVYGDLGTTNGVSLPMLRKNAQNATWDAIFHIGDFGYDLNTDNARIGDLFMNQIQPIAAHIPYMTCPGNHEYSYHFSNYIYRFNNPTPEEKPMFYSVDIGPAHIIMVNTEVYYYKEWNYTGAAKDIQDQMTFLSEDLKKANLAENRAKRPWIIVMGHRPMYCSNADHDDCATPETNPMRIGLRNKTTGILSPGMEKIFYDYGVDLQIYAHEHSYERIWPIYDMVVCNGTESPYVNPRAPVHITTGSAGNKENLDPFVKNPYNYSALRIDDYGFTKLRIYNATHLSIEQISSDMGGIVVDSFVLVKEKHGPGLYDCHK